MTVNATKCYDEGTLRAYVDEELDHIEREALNAHLAHCRECNQLMQQVQARADRVALLLSTYLSAPDPPPALSKHMPLVEPAAGDRQGARSPSMPVQTGLRAGVRSVRQRGISSGLPIHPIHALPRLVGLGLGLAVTILAVLGLSMVYTGHIHLGPAPNDQLILPRPSMPAGLASSVLVVNQQHNLGVSTDTGYDLVLHPLDTQTGQDAAGYEPIHLYNQQQPNYYMASDFSDDDTKLAVVVPDKQCESVIESGCVRSTGTLNLIDLQAWRNITSTITFEGRADVSAVVLNPDATRLALAYNQSKYDYDNNTYVFTSTLVLIDTSGRVIASRRLDFQPSLIQYSSNGSTLVIYGQPYSPSPYEEVAAPQEKPGPPRVLVLDAGDLHPLWDQALTDVTAGTWCKANCDQSVEQRTLTYWQPAVVSSHDRTRLYIVHADKDKLTTVNVQAHTVTTTDIGRAKSWFEQLLASTADTAEAKGLAEGATKQAVLSADGRRLYVLSTKMSVVTSGNQRQQKQEPQGLQVIDVESGAQLGFVDTEATSVLMSEDGAYLYLEGNSEVSPRKWQNWYVALDASSLQQTGRAEEWSIQQWFIQPTIRLDGEPVVLALRLSGETSVQQGYKYEYALFDPRTLQIVRSWTAASYGFPSVLTP